MVPLLSLELGAAGEAGISGAVAVALAAGARARAGAGAAFWVGEGAGGWGREPERRPGRRHESCAGETPGPYEEDGGAPSTSGCSRGRGKVALAVAGTSPWIGEARCTERMGRERLAAWPCVDRGTLWL